MLCAGLSTQTGCVCGVGIKLLFWPLSRAPGLPRGQAGDLRSVRLPEFTPITEPTELDRTLLVNSGSVLGSVGHTDVPGAGRGHTGGRPEVPPPGRVSHPDEAPAGAEDG